MTGKGGLVSRADDEQKPIIVVSNRGPVQFEHDGEQRTTKRGAGGLVTALSGLVAGLDDALWVYGAMGDEDVAVAREHGGASFTVEGPSGDMQVRMVELDPDVQHESYSIIANPLLWFLQHRLWGLAEVPDITRRETHAFEHGYTAANQRFADIVAEEVEAHGGRATVLAQDYHLYLFPRQLRARCPDALLHHFVHIPWPQADQWRILPAGMRNDIFLGLLGNDVVGFHTEHDARSFVLGCQDLLDLAVDVRARRVEVDGREVVARSYPISIDAAAFEAMASSPAVLAEERQLVAARREHLIVRVDRTDPSKNIVRGFRAFGLLLEEHPDLAGRITFLAFLQPSRQEVAEYVAYLDEIRRTAADINLAHGSTDWQPIDLRLGEDMDLAVAAYKQFDVLMVNSVLDGMNLVAKEATLVNERGGVLVLSENTGAHDELGAFAITVHPIHIQQQADALYEALTMGDDERRARHDACAAVVRHNDVSRWLERQLQDLRRLEDKTAAP